MTEIEQSRPGDNADAHQPAQSEDDFGATVRMILAEEARARGLERAYAMTTTMIAAGLCFVLNTCGPAVARQTWGDVKQAREEAIIFRKATPTEVKQ